MSKTEMDGQVSPSLVSLFAQQSPSTFSSSLNLRCFNTSAIFSATTSPFSARPHPPSVFDCLLDNAPVAEPSSSSPPMAIEVAGSAGRPSSSFHARQMPTIAPLPPLRLYAPIQIACPFTVGSSAGMSSEDIAAKGVRPIGLLATKPCLHDAIQWSADNRIAMIGPLDIDIVDASQQIDCVNTGLTMRTAEVTHIQLTAAPSGHCMITPVAIVCARWSPLGSSPNLSCLLAVLVNDGRALIYSQRSAWHVFIDVRAALGQADLEITALDWSPTLLLNRRAMLGIGTRRGEVRLLGIPVPIVEGRPQLTRVATAITVPGNLWVTMIRFSAEPGRGSDTTLLAVATADCCVHIYRLVADDLTISTSYVHRIIGPSPLSVVTMLEWSLPTSSQSSTKLACAMGSTISVTSFSPSADLITSTPFTAHSQAGMISGLIWAPNGLSIITVSTAGGMVSWVHNTVQQTLQRGVSDSAPLLALESLASRELLDYCDDDDNANVYLRGHVGLGCSPDRLLGAVFVPILSTSAVGRQGKSSSKSDLLFGLYIIPIANKATVVLEELLAPATNADRLFYLENACRTISSCADKSTFADMAARYESTFAESSPHADASTSRATWTENSAWLRSANVIYGALLRDPLLFKDDREQYTRQLKASIVRLVRIHASRILSVFNTWHSESRSLNCPPCWLLSAYLVAQWVRNNFLDCDDGAMEAAQVVMTALTPINPFPQELCPYCNVQVPMTSLLAEKCSNGHDLIRCRLTFHLMESPSVRRCNLCEGRFAPHPTPISLEGPSWSLVQPAGPFMCPVCHTHTAPL